MSDVQVRLEPTIKRPDARTKSRAILIATDGTAQSEPALAFVRGLASRSELDVQVVTVVEKLAIPWGGADLTFVSEYEAALRAEALSKTKNQVVSFGLSDWPVEVRSGDTAAAVSDAAEEANARLIVVGLGGHGPTARLFGSETALRLARLSRTPVLAVAGKFSEAPRRILVAMDFSEASIEAARLSLELAAKDATMVLAHVVPWDRREYVPEDWFRSHESAVASELSRVTRWLDADRKFRIGHRILYGKPASALLSYAEELGADLIVSGSHGRTLLGRVLAGQTVAKLIRGSRCSVLILPAAAAFKLYDRLSLNDATAGGKDWATRLDDFSRRNIARRGRLEVDDSSLGAQVEMSGYRFLGASFEERTGRATLMFGDTSGTAPHLVRGISNVKSIEILRDAADQRDAALAIGHDQGQTLLVFDDVATAGAPK